jgi:hypothetical protein
MDLDRDNDKLRCVYLHDNPVAISSLMKKKKSVDIVSLINTFNSEANRQGRLIQVIFGTDKTREGISLKRVEQIHICASDWNFGKIFQAMGRGIRYQSHAGMPPETKVQIFFHCAIPAQSNKSIISNLQMDGFKSSIDFFGYYRSECRDINIKLVEYAFLIGAVDCQLNILRNKKWEGIDNTTECLYQPCDYKCIGIPDDIDSYAIDDSTYNLYYISDILKPNITMIQRLFHIQIIYNLDSIVEKVQQESQMTKWQILSCLSFMIQAPIRIRYFDGRMLYLNNHYDTFFLTENRFQNSSLYNDNQIPWISRDVEIPSFTLHHSFSDIMNSLKDFQILKICRQMKIHFPTHPQKAKELFNLYSDQVKELFHKEIVKKRTLQNHAFLKWMRDHVLSDTIFLKDQDYLVKSPKGSIYKLSDTTTWIPLPKQIIAVDPRLQQIGKVDHDSQDFRKTYMEGKYIYGYLEDDHFKIRDVHDYRDRKDKKHSTTGRVCTTYGRSDLFLFVYRVSFPNFPSEEDLRACQLASLINTRTTILRKDEIALKAEANKPSVLELLAQIGKNLDEFDADGLRFLSIFAGFSRKDFCNYLEHLLKKLNLLSPPPIPRKKPSVRGTGRPRGRPRKENILG